MYSYSPIKTIIVKNFNNIAELVVSFADSPIVTLVGDNGAGKTSLMEAFSVCALHSNPRTQNEHIRDNTNMFGVIIELADGTKIARVKKSDANIYKVMRDDKVLFESSKISDGLPKVVQDVMGMMVEPETKEYLQIRSYSTKLIFVDTPASTNYKVMYNSLKVENLTRAIKVGNTEVNQMKASLKQSEIVCNTLSTQLKALRVYDLENAKRVSEALKRGLLLVDKLEGTIALKQKMHEESRKLGLYKLLIEYDVNEISMRMAMVLSRVKSNLDKMDESKRELLRISDASALESISLDRVNKMASVISKISALEFKKKENKALAGVAELGEIKFSVYDRLRRVRNSLDTLHAKQEEFKKTDADDAVPVDSTQISVVKKISSIFDIRSSIQRKTEELNSSISEANKITEYLKSIGVACETCQNCGSTVIIDLDKIKGA